MSITAGPKQEIFCFKNSPREIAYGTTRRVEVAALKTYTNRAFL